MSARVAWLLRRAWLVGPAFAWLLACGDAGDTEVFFQDPNGSPGASSGVTPSDGGGGGGTGDGGAAVDAAQPPGDYLVHNDAVNIDGVVHRFQVVEPRRSDRSARLPIVVAYHGDGQSSAALREMWQLELATNKSALIIYPDGDAQGGSAWGGYDAINVNSSHVTAFARIVNRATQVYRGDATKVVVAGLSSGGILAGVISCRYSAPGSLTLLATAIMSSSVQTQAAVDTVWDNGYPKCNGQRPVPTFIVHGDADQVFPAGYARTLGDYATYVNRMAREQPLGPQSTEGDNASTEPIPGLPDACRRYTESPPDAPVALCMVPGMPHQLWDNSAPTLWQFAEPLVR